MAIFEGAAVAIVTPFLENGDINFNKLGELIEYQVKGGTDAIVICGSTGEASTMSHEEHIECIRQAVHFTAGRVPVIAGTGSNCTDTAIYLSKEAEKAGADCLLVVSPYYNKGTQNGIAKHFTMVADAVKNTPILLYNIAGRTGVSIQPATVAGLVKNVDNIIGIKESVTDITEVVQTASLCNGEIDIYSGDDAEILPYMSIGAKGVISVLSNIMPRETHDIVARYLSGDVKGSLELQLKYFKLIKSLFMEVNPIPVKMALNILGFEVGGLRMPLTEMEPEHALLLAEEMKKNGLQVR